MLPDGCRSCFIGCILSICRLLLPVQALRHDVSGEVGERERKKLGQLSVIILTSAARFSSVSGPEIGRE
jgi:hypothetical protein